MMVLPSLDTYNFQGEAQPFPKQNESSSSVHLRLKKLISTWVLFKQLNGTLLEC